MSFEQTNIGREFASFIKVIASMKHGAFDLSKH